MQREEILSVLQAYKRDFSEKYGIIEMGVFGSVGRNDANDSSDLDIFVKMKMPDPFRLVHIKDDIEQRIKKHVDIIRVREKMNPCLRQRILKDAVYV